MKAIFLTLVACCLVGCGAAHYGATRFSNEDVHLGDTKESVVKRYGKPYIQEQERVDGKTVETLGYKEDMNYGYKINTFFVFEDGKLVRKVQEEDAPHHPSIKVEK
ncbi:MAG: hypothetical protein IJ721_05405 [Bacteroidales bacterium]|nr:hypothetical protein [Bacteroidales bacterium]